MLQLAKREYQKVHQENRHLRQQLPQTRKNYQNKKQIKRKYIIEQPKSESSTEEITFDTESQTTEEEFSQIKNKKQKIDKKRNN